MLVACAVRRWRAASEGGGAGGGGAKQCGGGVAAMALMREAAAVKGDSEDRGEGGRGNGGGGRIWTDACKAIQAHHAQSCDLIMLSANVWARQAHLKTPFFGHS